MIIIIIMNATKHLATSFKMGNFKQLVGTEEHLLFLVCAPVLGLKRKERKRFLGFNLLLTFSEQSIKLLCKV